MRPRLLYIAAVAASVALAIVLLAARRATAVERNFAGSAQLDYFWVPAERASTAARTTFDGFTSEVALKLAVDVSDKLSANVKVCHGCHGFELPMGYFDYRVFDELNFRVGRFSPSFGAFNVRHDPANHATSSKPLPYDMGRMLRMREWNMGVLPSPFPDNGIEIGGTHWFGDSVQMDYASYAVSGFKGDQFAADIEWSHSYSQNSLLVDNNGQPAVGGRMAFTLRVGEANDLTAGASVMYGTWDQENRLSYTIAGGDLAARVGRTQLRFEYLMRRQAFEVMPGQLKFGGSGVQVFDKHGAYMEVERMVNESLTLVGRADGLYRVGNVPVDSTLERQSWIGRLTGGGTLAVMPGWRIKASAELWAFPPRPLQDQVSYELALHLALVGTF
jgi:hypothetical protein